MSVSADRQGRRGGSALTVNTGCATGPSGSH